MGNGGNERGETGQGEAGPSKYDRLTRGLCASLGAEGVVVCVVGGERGTGACMALDYARDVRAARRALAFVLRRMADDLERAS